MTVFTLRPKYWLDHFLGSLKPLLKSIDQSYAKVSVTWTVRLAFGSNNTSHLFELLLPLGRDRQGSSGLRNYH
jgi:hypothetical protein